MKDGQERAQPVPEAAPGPEQPSPQLEFAALLRPTASGRMSPRQLAQLQRSAGNQAVARLLRQLAPPAVDGAANAGTLLVADDAQAGPGQMAVSAFLERVEKAVCEVAERELAGSIYSTAGCPWIAHWIAHYRQRPPAEVQAAISRYAPAAADARTLEAQVAAICGRVEEGIRAWSTTGEVPQPPDDAPGPPPGLPADASPTQPAAVARTPADERASLGPGRPLDTSLAARMGAALEADVSRVRIHADAQGAALAAREGARATAVGEHIAFASGAYAPGTPVGDALLAHEIAHTVQQADGALAEGDRQADEADATRAAIGAVAGLWGGGSALARRLARDARPALRSGLALRSCNAGQWDPPKADGIWVKTGNLHGMMFPADLPLAGDQGQPTPQGARFDFDSDGDQRRDMQALLKVNEPTAGTSGKGTVHVELTQLSSHHTNQGDLELPEIGGDPLPAATLAAVTDGRHPTEFQVSQGMVVRVHPMSGPAGMTIPVGPTGQGPTFGPIFTVDIGDPGSDNGGYTAPLMMAFPFDPQAGQDVFSTAPDTPGGKPSSPRLTGDIWSLDVAIGVYGDRFRLSFNRRPDSGTVTFGLGVLSEGDPVGGEAADLAVKGPLHVKILANQGARLSLDLDGDGREDLVLYDRLSVPSKETLEQENGRDPQLVPLRSPMLYRDHDLFAEGPSLATPRTYHFPVREGMMRAGDTTGAEQNRAGASDLRAVTGLAEQRELGTFNKEEGQLLGEISYVNRMLIGLRQKALEDGLISKELFEAWRTLSTEFLVLDALRAGKKPDKSFTDRLADHAQAFYDELDKATPKQFKAVGGGAAVTSNDYTGDATVAGAPGAGASPGRAMVAAIRKSDWDVAEKNFRRLVEGLDKWVAHSNREKYGDPDRTKPETMRGVVGEHLLEQRSALEDMKDHEPTRVAAVIHGTEGFTETGQISEVPLSLYYWKQGGYWRIKDLSRPDDMPTWVLQMGPGDEQRAEPPAKLFEKLDEGPHFPKGTIHWMLPSGRGGRVTTSGPSAFRTWATAVIGAAAAIGLGLVTFGAGTVAVAGTYILAGSAILGAGMAAYDLVERAAHDNLSASTFLLDIGQIVSSLTGLGALRAGQLLVGARMAAAAGEVAEASAALQWANRWFIPLRGMNLGSDVLTLAVMTADLEKQVKAIQDSGATPDEQSRSFALLFTQFALTGGLTALAVKGAIPELTAGRSLTIEMVNGVEYAVPVGTSIQGKAVNQSRAAVKATDPASRLEHLATIRKQIGGALGDNFADVELMSLRPQAEGELSVDGAGNLRRGDAAAGTLEDLLGKVTQANNAAAAHGIETQYSLRVQPRGGDGRSPVQVIAEPRGTGGDPTRVSEGVIRQYLSSQTGRTDSIRDALSRLRAIDPQSRIEVLPDGQLRLNGQIDIDAARIADIEAAGRATATKPQNVGTPTPDPLGEHDLRTLLQGTRELDARGGDMKQLEKDFPSAAMGGGKNARGLADALKGLSSSGEYRLRFQYQAQQAREWAASLRLDANPRVALQNLIAQADEGEVLRMFDIVNEGAPKGAGDPLAAQSALVDWALSQNPTELHGFVARYQFARGEYYNRVGLAKARVKTLVAEGMRDAEAQKQVGWSGPGQPRSVDELVWQDMMRKPGSGEKLGKDWKADLNMVEGHVGGVPLKGRGDGSPLPPPDGELIDQIKQARDIPMPDADTAAYHTRKHHHELPKELQFDPEHPRPGISSEFDAYMEAAWKAIGDPDKGVTVAASQDGTGRVITFARELVKDGKKVTSKAIVLVGYDGHATLLSYIPGELMSRLRFIDPDATPDGLRALLAGGVEPTVTAQNARAFPFLAGLGGLGLRGAIDDSFVGATADGVDAVWAGVRSFADDLEALVRDTFVGDEWRQAMERRSALQFLLDAYARTPLAERFPYLEVDDLDALLRRRGQTEGFLREEDVPAGVPESHWWWRLP